MKTIAEIKENPKLEIQRTDNRNETVTGHLAGDTVQVMERPARR